MRPGAGLAAIALLAPPAADVPPPPATEYAESIDVEVWNVEVHVTDRAGRPVTGLQAGDFVVEVDGEPATITNFLAVEPPSAPRDPAAARVVTAAGGPSDPTAQPLHIAIVVDQSSLTPGKRHHLLQAVHAEIAAQTLPAGWALVASLDDDGLEIVQPPTRDPRAVAAALAGVDKAAPPGLQRLAAGRRLARALDLTESQDEDGAREQHMAILLHAQQRADGVRATLRALGELVDQLAGLPGRKVLLLVTGGVELRPGEALLRAWEIKFGPLARVLRSPMEAFDQDLSSDLSALLRRANDHGVTINSLGATNPVFGTSAALDSWGGTIETIETANLAQSLRLMARSTGGLASVDALRPAAMLADLRRDLGTYYSLGYVPRDRHPDRQRRLAVRVRRPGLTVRHRESFREHSPAERMRQRVLTGLALGAGDDNAMGLQLAVAGREPAPGPGRVRVEVVVAIPVARLLLVPAAQGHEARLQIFVAARDEAGETSPIRQLGVAVHVPASKLPVAGDELARYRLPLVVRDGPQTIVVTVLDERANESSTVSMVL
jgi:VWFA-related protein